MFWTPLDTPGGWPAHLDVQAGPEAREAPQAPLGAGLSGGWGWGAHCGLQDAEPGPALPP